MSTSSTASSLSLADLFQSQAYYYNPAIRADSPLLGFDTDSDDPLHFPAPNFPRDLCDAKQRTEPLPLPPAVIPALHKRASALSLRNRASALSLRRAPTNSSIYPDSARNAVYIDVDDVGERLGAFLHASTISRASSFDSIDEDVADADDAAYFHSFYENAPGPSSQVYLGSPSTSTPSSPFTLPDVSFPFPYHSTYTSTATSPACTPLTPLSPPVPHLAPPPHIGSRWSLTSSLDVPPPPSPADQNQSPKKEKEKTGLKKKASALDLKDEKTTKTRKRLTSFMSRLSLGAGGLLSSTPSVGSSPTLPHPQPQEREMQKAYLGRDDPPLIIRSLGPAYPPHGEAHPSTESEADQPHEHEHQSHASTSSWSSLMHGLRLSLPDEHERAPPPVPTKDKRTRPALSISTRFASSGSTPVVRSPQSELTLLSGHPTPTPTPPAQYHYTETDADASPSSPMAFTCAPPSPTPSALDLDFDLDLDIDAGPMSRRERQRRMREKQLQQLPSASVFNLTLTHDVPPPPPMSPVREKAQKKSTPRAPNKDADADSILSLGLGVLAPAPPPCYSPTSPSSSTTHPWPTSTAPAPPPEKSVRNRRSMGAGLRGLMRMRMRSAPAVPTKAVRRWGRDMDMDEYPLRVGVDEEASHAPPPPPPPRVFSRPPSPASPGPLGWGAGVEKEKENVDPGAVRYARRRESVVVL